MIDKIRTMKITDFDGKNVSEATGQIEMMLKRLEVLGQVPEDINKNLLYVGMIS